MDFTITASDPSSAARVGRLTTPRGEVQTPLFMPCASRAFVRACSAAQLGSVGVRMAICNAYHLMLRPGAEVVAAMGGLHPFMGWPGLLATDSGGYQVFSLGAMSKISEEGVRFRSEVDGRSVLLSPELSIQVQRALGADLAMCFDECAPYPCTYDYARDSLERTLRWAERCKREHGLAGEQGASDRLRSAALFGIAQGGVFADLRERSARETVAMGFDGYSIGGLSVGESRQEMLDSLDAALVALPREKPRYAMGVGTPRDIVQCVARGVDIFDCVLPTRNARHGSVLTAEGVVKIANAPHRNDPRPLEAGCDCPACLHHSRAYLHHLVRSGEALAWTLLSLHNLRFYMRLMERIREAIPRGELGALSRELSAFTGRDAQA